MADLGTINELTTARYTATLLDENQDPIDGNALDSLTLTAYDVRSGLAIGDRTAQDVLNKNGVTVSAAGELEWIMTPADNAIIGTGKRDEQKAGMFVAAWGGSGEKQCRHEFKWTVRNLLKASSLPPGV